MIVQIDLKRISVALKSAARNTDDARSNAVDNRFVSTSGEGAILKDQAFQVWAERAFKVLPYS